ncbi:hypothetical protein EUTSA_v10008096mg [Eutrema salsugineum]|uniref:Uncharacterized protein n=1 Tax=Eutrema salsugineum TaxID=72664 RepID=V4L372_EUTSA|nr:uncharacterized protein LOC18992383 [Eutrema salsugineum]XP_006415841.1 uncharacterized protein LOC18992383 [Eutrema salsugineum]XP_024009015.1 uncharacterized protein LOC18992383 [Eutrema salsugineum]ESQ34193.1 hypothetical protein EUTSA_v10008096mg [Eutrema salsugineum]ESQ34194.1 hypothetical protein EUTSA_v10008096mg [Eutrema salsugineum]
MGKARRARRRISARRIRARPYKFTSSKRVVGRSVFANNCPKVMEKNEWADAVCSVCMECPHNAVLLLCSSHDKGCRPYMCGTSFRYSNCLDQYKKASAKLMPSHQQPINSKSELANLKCPLCRGQVKGWTIVKPARDDLNLKKRSCMQENCSFAGTFKELRNHMKMDHPCAQPREVDPDVEQKWRSFETEQDRNDVISTIRSTMPGATVFGDYVIERGAYGSDSDSDTDDDDDHDDNDVQREEEGRIGAGIGRNLVNVFLLLQAFGASGNNNNSTALGSDTSHDLASDANDLVINQSDVESSGQEEAGAMSSANRIRSQRRVVMGRAVSRRRRDREANQNSDHPR